MHHLDKAPEPVALPLGFTLSLAGQNLAKIGGAALGAAHGYVCATPPIICSSLPVPLREGECGQVVETAADIGVVGTQRAAAPFRHIAEGRLGLVEPPGVLQEQRVVVARLQR